MDMGKIKLLLGALTLLLSSQANAALVSEVGVQTTPINDFSSFGASSDILRHRFSGLSFNGFNQSGKLDHVTIDLQLDYTIWIDAKSFPNDDGDLNFFYVEGYTSINEGADEDLVGFECDGIGCEESIPKVLTEQQTYTANLDTFTSPYIIDLDMFAFGFANCYKLINGPCDGLVGWRDIELSGMATYSYSAVPVPAAIWLFGTGLIGLVGFSRRKAA